MNQLKISCKKIVEKEEDYMKTTLKKKQIQIDKGSNTPRLIMDSNIFEKTWQRMATKKSVEIFGSYKHVLFFQNSLAQV